MASKKSKKTTALTAQPDPRAPLDAPAFLSATQKVLALLRDDLLARADGSEGVTWELRAEWDAARAAKRTADPYEPWRRRVVVQIAAAWVLSVAFVRTLEDRDLLARNRIAGPGAADSQRQFFDLAPFLTERQYLLMVFRELSNLPAAKELFDPAHNPVWKLAPSPAGARALLDLFRAVDADAPAFRFGQSDTRFLGDLYQDLDEETRKRFALLQTPRFVESFILDQTLEPAIREYGLDQTTLLDPTCGSGHFLLGAFERLLDHRLREKPGSDIREAATKALAAVHGADINPYAVAIARFRLTLAFLEKGGYAKLDGAPALPLHVVIADSLLHGRGSTGQATFGERRETEAKEWLGDMYSFVDEAAAKEVLGKEYAAVVGNPPYITVQDAALRDAYRALYTSCHREYSLAAPFAERFFQLARKGGFAGMITANSFMKREFGKKLIQDYLIGVDLDLIVNTSGAYIPGHGTPTVLLFGRHRTPVEPTVVAVLAKRGEPSTPEQAESGLVWRSIAQHFREIGFENEFVSVANVDRTTLAKHPWSLGGGGASELKALLEAKQVKRLEDIVDVIGFGCITRADDLYFAPRHALRNAGVSDRYIIENVEGEVIRDWALVAPNTTVFPYDEQLNPVSEESAPEVHRFLWPHRTMLWLRREPNGNHRELGKTWWEWSRFQRERFRRPLSIAFAFVATHNHFVLDRGGKVFKQSAPIIKLPEGATEEEHLALLGYLNSSTALFWMKQVFYPKATSNGDISTEKGKPEANRYEFAGTGMLPLPLPTLGVRLMECAREMEAVVLEMRGVSPSAAIEASLPGRSVVAEFKSKHEALRERMIAIQEDVDWIVYAAFGLANTGPSTRFATNCRLRPEDRPSAQVAQPPAYLSSGDASIWKERHAAIVASPELAMLESPAYKRQWLGARGVFGSKVATYEEQAAAAWRNWFLDDFERTFVARLPTVQPGNAASASPVLALEVAAAANVTEALRSEAVPYLAALRHTAAGLEKRAVWERTWDLQRQEDAGKITSAPATADDSAYVGSGADASGMFVSKDGSPNGAFVRNRVTIPVPPKYGQDDFSDQAFWRLRGKLDVPKERFISYPGCESDEDKSPVYGWAGWNHLQQAQALAALYQKRKTEEGWAKDRLTPMLAGLDELVPWVKQWHNEPSAEFGGMRLGDYFADFVAAQCQELGTTLDEVRAWRPATAKEKRAAKAAKKAKAAAVESEES